MLIDFIGMFAAGFGTAGVVMLLNRLTGRRFAKWAMPAAIGVAMLGFTIYREYTWYPGIVAQLSPEMVIAVAPADRVAYRPWTYLVPQTLRFVAVDGATMLRSAAAPDLRVADAVIVQRWMPTRRVRVAFDCAGFRRADLVEGAGLAEGGALTGVDWREVGSDDALLKAACNGG